MTDCGPGVLWSALPLELVLEGLVQPPAAVREVVVDGRLLQVTPGGDGHGTVVRLISGRAEDYLDARFQPGARVRLGRNG
ncbi:MAG: YlzJ-like family protein [Symbiobacterium sp.]|uniref:YlzJ-like family protein n=1 Tax=Symbiobacterium sp. TaxID=1971213 RepID=UPI0034645A5F